LLSSWVSWTRAEVVPNCYYQDSEKETASKPAEGDECHKNVATEQADLTQNTHKRASRPDWNTL